MLSRLLAKNVGDVFLKHSVDLDIWCDCEWCDRWNATEFNAHCQADRTVIISLKHDSEIKSFVFRSLQHLGHVLRRWAASCRRRRRWRRWRSTLNRVSTPAADHVPPPPPIRRVRQTGSTKTAGRWAAAVGGQSSAGSWTRRWKAASALSARGRSRRRSASWRRCVALCRRVHSELSTRCRWTPSRARCCPSCNYCPFASDCNSHINNWTLWRRYHSILNSLLSAKQLYRWIENKTNKTVKNNTRETRLKQSKKHTKTHSKHTDQNI